VILACAGAIVFASYGSSSTYEKFAKAKENEGTEYHVVGKLNKDKPFEYNPMKNANHFAFYLIDDAGTECKVIYNNPKPQDFERSDKIVTVGEMRGNEFYASQILLKCPSKYEDGAEQMKKE
jgi:cytochrome c-type biogenesis protein CcmE